MPELHGQQRNVVAAWQQALSHMFPNVKVAFPLHSCVMHSHLASLPGSRHVE